MSVYTNKMYALENAAKELGTQVKSVKTKHTFKFLHRTLGQNRNVNTASKFDYVRKSQTSGKDGKGLKLHSGTHISGFPCCHKVHNMSSCLLSKNAKIKTQKTINLFVLYARWCETLVFTLMKYHTFRLIMNKLLNRAFGREMDEVTKH